MRFAAADRQWEVEKQAQDRNRADDLQVGRRTELGSIHVRQDPPHDGLDCHASGRQDSYDDDHDEHASNRAEPINKTTAPISNP